MYGTKLKKFDGWVLHTSGKDGDEGGDVAATLPAPMEHNDGGQDNCGAASEDSDDEIMACGPRAVQVLAIRANFPFSTINGYDMQQGQCIYTRGEREVQEEGMVDLVLIGPRHIFLAYGPFVLEVFYYTPTAGVPGFSRAPPIEEGWDTDFDDRPREYTQTICPGPDPGRRLEITYLVIPKVVEAEVEVRLKLKDLGSQSRAVYGKIKASATGYRNKSVYLFSCERGRSWSCPSGSISILPLSPSMIAMPYCQQLALHVEVDLTIITTCDCQDNQKVEDKNLKFTLIFSRRFRERHVGDDQSQERDVGDDQIEVNIAWDFHEH
ncbi:hypothetical protein QOZ80_5AG0376670 [Eleusine coracana subsp. coracana]|nr:hypothetical protein QOZ80_5AG0376670 [Eleusine coracana subsp. coracana]